MGYNYKTQHLTDQQKQIIKHRENEHKRLVDNDKKKKEKKKEETETEE